MSDSVTKDGHEMVFGLKVAARANGISEELYFLDFDAGFKQYGILKAAGYKEVLLTPTYFVHDDDGEWHPVSIGLAVSISDQSKPARYTRADINPGIGVRRYEREVLKRPRATNAELICVTVLTILIAAAATYLVLKPTELIATALQLEGRMIWGLAAVAMCVLLRYAERPINAAIRIAEKIVGVPSIEEWKAN